MRIIAKRTLRAYWEKHPDARSALQAWHADARCANWSSPADIKSAYRNASIVGGDRVVFNIKGNRHRLVARVVYAYGIVYIRFIGSHSDYDQIDAATV